MAPKTATGAELQLDDGPARDSELFLVDGNNLAYRAYYALPEELATSDGFPTNALLGFVNMLFKLLVDYQPKAVAVAWDTRPVHRLEVSQDYKAERKEMPGLLREQFPHFARSSRRSAIAISSSRAGRPTTSSPPSPPVRMKQASRPALSRPTGTRSSSAPRTSA